MKAITAILMFASLAGADELSECARLVASGAYADGETMPDGTKSDLSTPEFAIEVDWAQKWKEAPGQAVLYAIWTGKKPAVLLLVKDAQKDKLHLLRCKLVCERLGIEMFTEQAQEGRPQTVAGRSRDGLLKHE